MQGTRQLRFISRGLEDLVHQPRSTLSRGLQLHLPPKTGPALLTRARHSYTAMPRALYLPPFTSLASKACGQRGRHLQLHWGLSVSKKKGDEWEEARRSLLSAENPLWMKLTPSQGWCARVRLQSQESWRQEFPERLSLSREAPVICTSLCCSLTFTFPPALQGISLQMSDAFRKTDVWGGCINNIMAPLAKPLLFQGHRLKQLTTFTRLSLPQVARR